MVRARMPHNNRVTAGNALKTTDIWTKTIGHNPVSVMCYLLMLSIHNLHTHTYPCCLVCK